MALYQVENALAKKSSDERQGLELSGKKNADLFFIDKVQVPAKEGGFQLQGRRRNLNSLIRGDLTVVTVKAGFITV